MLLSVILPCYNGAATLAVQLEALTRQQWDGGWEVVLVDNGSTDGSRGIAEAYAGRLPGLRIVDAHVPGTPRRGVPHSYNTGIAAARGEAFVFCEADDEVAPGWLQAMGEALQEHPFVVGRLEHRKLNALWLHPPTGDGYQANGLFRNAEAPGFLSASAASFGLRRSLYLQLGPLSLDFPIAHDSEYCWRAQLAGIAPQFVPGAVVHYRERAGWRARFVQGRNWGRDSVRLRLHYGAPVPRWPLLRQLAWIARTLPGGMAAAAHAASGDLQGRRRWADWVWNFGWSVGKAQALRQRHTVPVRPGAAAELARARSA